MTVWQLRSLRNLITPFLPLLTIWLFRRHDSAVILLMAVLNIPLLLTWIGVTNLLLEDTFRQAVKKPRPVRHGSNTDGTRRQQKRRGQAPSATDPPTHDRCC